MALMKKKRHAHLVLKWKPYGKKPLGRSIYGWEDVDWIELAQHSDKRQAVMNITTSLELP